MAGELVFAAWRVSGTGERERLTVNAGPAGGSRIVASLWKGGVQTLVSAGFRETGWQRVAFYAQNDPQQPTPSLPQILLNLVGFDDNVISLDPSPGHEKFHLDIAIRNFMSGASGPRSDQIGSGSVRLTMDSAFPNGIFHADGSMAIGSAFWTWVNIMGSSSSRYEFSGHPGSIRQMAESPPAAGFVEPTEPLVLGPAALGLVEDIQRSNLPDYRTRWIYFIQVTDGAPGKPNRYLLALRQRFVLRGPVSTNFAGLTIASGLSQFGTDHRLVQRQRIDDLTADFQPEKPQTWQLEVDGLPGESIRNWWQSQFLPGYQRGLRQVLGQTGLSFAPDFANCVWSVAKYHLPTGYYRFDDSNGWWLVLQASDFLANDAAPAINQFTATLTIDILGLVPMTGMNIPASIEPAAGQAWSASLPMLRGHDGKPLSFAVAKFNFPPPGKGRFVGMSFVERDTYGAPGTVDPGLTDIAVRDNAKGFKVQAELAVLDHPAASVSAIGAFDLAIWTAEPPGLAGDKAAIELTVVPGIDRENSIGPLRDYVAGAGLTGEVKVKASLFLASFAPGTQDIPPGGGAAPLLISRLPPKDATDGRYSLRAVENAPREQEGDPAPFQDERTLLLQIFDAQVADGETFDAIVLDTNPLMIARVRVSLSADQLDTSSVLIAQAERGPGKTMVWSFANPSAIELRLPPQGVGETMEKRKTFLNDNDFADFRFSPPARLTIDMSGGFGAVLEVPWNVRRLLGYPEELISGSPVQRIDAELLYGKGLEYVVPGIAGNGPAAASIDLGPHAAEIGARFGRPPGPANRDDGYDSVAADTWDITANKLAGRLGVIEIYDPTAPAQFNATDGVSYVLRPSAALRYPIASDPALPSVPIADASRPASNAPWSEDPQQMLAGGVGWGFESANIYESTWAPTDRDTFDPGQRVARGTGQIAAFFLSPLGGWARQTALFDNRLTEIKSQVAMGRTHFLSLARIGRIGVFWNHAKHVLVYERTVTPTLQFVDSQTRLPGRPILRKVREYVQIIQPVRNYPDDGSAPGIAGFLKACQFRSKEIPVDSAWGADVRTRAWKVPLWKSSADPAIYPKPHIVLQFAAHPDSGVDKVEAAINNPDRVTFYSMTNIGGAARFDDNTDAWPSQPGLDFADAPRLTKPDVPPWITGAPTAAMPDPLPEPPGHESFTFALTPTSHDVNLVDGRSGKGVGAQLRNLTLARAMALTKAAQDPPDWYQDASRAANRIAEIPHTVDRALIETRRIIAAAGQNQISRDAATATLRNVLNPLLAGSNGSAALLDQIGQSIARLASAGSYNAAFAAKPCDALNNASQQALAAAAARIDALSWQAWTDAKQSIARQWPAANATDLLGLLSGAATGLVDGLPSPSGATGAIDAAIAEATHQAQAWSDSLTGTIDTLRLRLPKPGEPLPDAISTMVSAGLDALAALAREALALAGTLTGLLSGNLADNVAGAVQLAGMAIAFSGPLILDAAAAALDEPTIEMLDTALGALQDALFQVASDLIDTLGEIGVTVADAADDMLDSWLDAVTRTANGPAQGVTTFLRAVAADPQLLVAHPRLPWPAAEQRLDTLYRDNIAAGISNAVGAVGTIEGNSASGPIQLLCDALDASPLSGKVSELKATLGGLVDNLVAAAQQEIDQIASGLKDVSDAVSAAMTGVEQEIQNAAGRAASLLAGGIQDVVAGAADAAQPLLQQADTAMRLLRAFGDPPKLPDLDFVRNRVAYFFDTALDGVDMTPVAALLRNGAESLKSLGLRLPTDRLADQLLPAALQNVDFSTLIPHIAGLNLNNLLPSLRLDQLDPKQIQLRHGVDPQTKRGWVEATLDISRSDTTTLLAFGPIAVNLVAPHFTADTRADGGLTGGTSARISGQVLGDWEMVVGGFQVVSFVQTPLRFDSANGVHFDIKPDNVRMDAALQFISDMMEQFSAGADDLAAGLGLILLRQNGIPIGAAANLNLPIPDVQVGAFGLSNMNFGAGFALRALPEFELSLNAYFGRKTAPFNLAIFILGGGGWVEASATYRPLSGALITQVSIGIAVSASLAISLGPIRGGIAMYAGIHVEFYSTSSGQSALTVGLMVLIVGQASLAGLVTVSIQLLMDASYHQDGTLEASGTLSYAVKICWCFTLRVSAGVHYVFNKRSGQSRAGTSRAAQIHRDYD